MLRDDRMTDVPRDGDALPKCILDDDMGCPPSSPKNIGMPTMLEDRADWDEKAEAMDLLKECEDPGDSVPVLGEHM